MLRGEIGRRAVGASGVAGAPAGADLHRLAGDQVERAQRPQQAALALHLVVPLPGIEGPVVLHQLRQRHRTIAVHIHSGIQHTGQLPQQLINVPNVDKNAAVTNAEVRRAVDRETALLGETGRVLLRPSGTEPLVRVMAEAATQKQADEVCERLAEVVARELAI